MTRLRIQLDDRTAEAAYERALARLAGVERTGGDDAADALLTDSPTLAAQSARPTLLHRPERLPVAELAALHGAPVMPAHPWRFRPDVLAVHDALTAGELGAPALLRIHRWSADSGRSSLRQVAFPHLDLAHWFFGAPPAITHHHHRECSHHLHLGFPGDGMAVIHCARVAAGADFHSLHLIGSAGAAYAGDQHNQPVLHPTGGDTAAHPDPQDNLALVGLLTEFAAAVHEQRPWSVALADTIAALTTLQEVPNA